MTTFAPNLADTIREVDRLSALVASTTQLAPAHRKLIAEVVLVRLSILIESQTKSICCKIVCGAPFLDTSNPVLLQRSRSASAAISAMQNTGRAKPRHPIWNTGKGVRENLKFLVDPNDQTIRTLTNYAPFLTDVRYVRNHIAHNNDGTRANYKTVVSALYGAYPRGVTPGTLLLTSAFGPINLLDRHLRTTKIYIRDLVRG